MHRWPPNWVLVFYDFGFFLRILFSACSHWLNIPRNFIFLFHDDVNYDDANDDDANDDDANDAECYFTDKAFVVISNTLIIKT